MPVLWSVVLDLVPLMGRATSSGVFWGVCELSTTLGSLSANGWVCVCLLLVVRHEASSTGVCRQLGGIGTWSRDGDSWESSHRLMFPEAGNSLAVQCPGFSVSTPEAQTQPPAGE